MDINEKSTPTLLDEPTRKLLWGRYSLNKIERFDKWTARNPIVYRLFKKFAEQWRDAGNAKCSASLIGNRIRWETAIATKGGEYKLSNDFLPMLARRLVCEDASYLNFFSFHGLDSHELIAD